jgi:RNA polymerase sigma-70 factor, ECF subfamily
VTTKDQEASNEVVVSVAIDKARAGSLDDDLAAIERFLGGEESAFELLYAKYYDKVHAIARGILLDSDEASDAVQEVFTLVYRHLSRFDRRSRFSTWLFRIAVNRSIQHARSNRHRSKHVPLNEAITTEAPEHHHEEDPRIHATLERLQPSDRALLVLFYWEELSLNEIADSIGCNVNAAKTRLYRARERFRVIYEEMDS